MEKKAKGRLEVNEKLYLGVIFVLLGFFHLTRLLNLEEIIVFSFSLGAFMFALADFFDQFKKVFMFLGLFSIISLPLLLNPHIIPEIRKFVDERSMMLFTIGIGFINLYFLEPKRKNCQKRLDIEYERGKLEILGSLKREILNKKEVES